MSGRRSAGRAGRRAPRTRWTLPAILLSGAIMLIASGPPAAAAERGADRSPSTTAIAGVDDLPDAAAVAVAVTTKLGYAPATSAHTVIGPLDLYLLETGAPVTVRLPADAGWTTTDPQRGPPATPQ